MNTVHNQLFLSAREAFSRAYAPYSQFAVGASILTTNGQIFSGCNVENVAYPEGTCAEAGAIAAMICGGESEIAKILVMANAPKPVTPCGGCRQKISEFCNETTELILANPNHIQQVFLFREIFPSGFEKAHLSS